MEYKDPGGHIPIIYLLYFWGSLFGVPSRVPLILRTLQVTVLEILSRAALALTPGIAYLFLVRDEGIQSLCTLNPKPYIMIFPSSRLCPSKLVLYKPARRLYRPETRQR